ncbi:ComEC/Rec2 family competence protein [Polaromonas naphthalenivorans]|nr:hypothetical protein [Polaromonas naphthalenivorans]
MNRHFSRQNDSQPDVPSRAYGRVDHLERDDKRPNRVLLGIDLIDANWLDHQGVVDPSLDLSLPSEKLDRLWKVRIRSLGPGAANPFENAPLYRLELEIDAGDPLAQNLRVPHHQDPFSRQRVAAMERSWFTLELRPGANPDNPALLYGGLFAPAAPVTVKGAMPSEQKIAKALDQMFTLRHLTQLTSKDFAREVGTPHADYLAVYDVGQGNANALAVNSYGWLVPTLYFDLGAGVYRNAKTRPNDLRFCFSYNPVIVLSHWDADHWAGAYATLVNNTYPALKQKWIAPLQKVGPTHTAFAYDVKISGGTFQTYAGAGGSFGSVLLPGHRTLHYARGSGPDRNGSGLVLVVENNELPPPRSWLLTGDCDYADFVPILNPVNPIGMVAPHHGASLAPDSPIPPPAALPYRRLAYSYGHENAHGNKCPPTRHPTQKGTTAHANAGWNHNAWSLNKPGTTTPGGNVLATCEHAPGTSRGGAVIGWHSPPGPMTLSCPHKLCSAQCTQR